MTDEPVVSVVIPTYDRPDRVVGAVRNVLDQTYKEIEPLVVDDHSPEPVGDVLRAELGDDHGVTVIRHETNRGANAARNTGIERSDSEYVAFLDDDDRWAPSKIARQVARLESTDPSVAIAYTGKVYLGSHQRVRGVDTTRLTGDPTRRLLLNNDVGSFSSLLVTRRVFDTVGLLDEAFPCLQDTDFLVRATQEFDLTCIQQPLTVRVFHGDQITGDFESRAESAVPRFIEKHANTAAKIGGSFPSRMRSRQLFNTGWNGVVNGQYRRALPYLLGSIQETPTWTRPYLALVACLGGRFGWRLVQTVTSLFDEDRRVGDRIDTADGTPVVTDSTVPGMWRDVFPTEVKE